MLLKTLMFLVWALVAGSAVFWGFKLLAAPQPVPAHATVAVQSAVAVGELTALLGTRPAAAPAAVEAPEPVAAESSRFQLIGVVAARHAAHTQGVALIAVDGKQPRAYRVGTLIDRDLVLQSVQARSAVIGPRGGVALVSLELPAVPPPSTGVPGATATVPVFPAPVPPPGLPQPMTPTLSQALPGPTGAAPAFNPSQPLSRLRAARRMGTQPEGVTMPDGVMPLQQDGQPAENRPPQHDGRNLR